jgi:hypothetical protein
LEEKSEWLVKENPDPSQPEQPVEPPKVNVPTDKGTYKIGDRVKVVGEITGIQSNNDFPASSREVSIKILDPHGNTYNSIKTPLEPDDEFVGYLDMADTPGYHRIIASFMDDGTFYDAETSFSVTAAEKPIPMELMTILAIGGPAGFASYKMLKSKPKPKPKADILRLGIECGIEEANRTKINEFGSLHFTCNSRKIEEKFTSIWSVIQESREKARQLQNVKEFSDWCKEAKEDPNLVVSKISDEIIGKLLSCARPFFTNLLLDDICLKSQYNILNKNNNLQRVEAMNSYAQHKLQFLMKPIHPYVEIALLVNEIKKSAAKLVFKVETCVYINKIEASSSSTGIRINTQGLNVSLAFSISKLCISHFSKPIDLAIPLGEKEFLINELNLDKCMEVPNKSAVGTYSYTQSRYMKYEV